MMWQPMPDVAEMKADIYNLKNFNDLERIYFISWEDGDHNLSDYFKTENAPTLIAEFLEEISAKLGRDIYFYLFTLAPEGFWPCHFDRNDPKFRLIKLIYFPTFMFHRTQYRIGPDNRPEQPQDPELVKNYPHNLAVTGLDITDPYTGLDKTDFKYTYIYMVLYPKPHRARMMDLLAKHDLHGIGAISWREYNRNLDRSTIPEGRLDSQHDIGDSPYPWKYWTPRRIFLDQTFDTPGPIKFDWLPKEYSESFFQIIGESIGERPLVSEKTVVPLFFNKPFLISSGPHSHKLLEDMGFKLYDEIFDYSFDNETSMTKRYEGIVLNVKRIHKMIEEQGAAALLDKIKDKLIFNKKRAHEITVDSAYFPKEIDEFFTMPNTPYTRMDKWHSKNIFNTFPFFEYAKRFNSTILKK